MDRNDAQAIVDEVLTETAWAYDEPPTITLSDRVTSSRMATSYLTRGEIVFYWQSMRHDPRTFFEDTVRHELAHFLAYALYRERAHGKRWRECAEALGAYPRAAGDVTDTLAYVAKNRPNS